MKDTITLPLDDILKHASPESLTRELLARARTSAPIAPTPRIGANWPAGGIYAGLVRGVDGGPDAHLIVHDEAKAEITHSDALKWAEQLATDERYTWGLPTRAECAVLFGNVPELFDKENYWSCPQYAGDGAYAWCQSFYHGLQYGNLKTIQLRARAVRRSAI